MSRIVLFDVDRTLIDTGGAGRAAINDAFRDLFAVENVLDGMTIDGWVDHGIFTAAMQAAGVQTDPGGAAYARAKRTYLERLPARVAASQGRVLPGVERLLEALRAQHATAIGLATGNFREGARLKLGHFGLWEHFPTGGFGDHEHERARVVAAALDEAARAAGMDPDPAAAVVIGDTPRDVEAARALGIRAIGVTTGAYEAGVLLGAGADAVCADLGETDAVLALIAG